MNCASGIFDAKALFYRKAVASQYVFVQFRVLIYCFDKQWFIEEMVVEITIAFTNCCPTVTPWKFQNSLSMKNANTDAQHLWVKIWIFHCFLLPLIHFFCGDSVQAVHFLWRPAQKRELYKEHDLLDLKKNKSSIKSAAGMIFPTS